jgi:potassium efflux system protein
MTILRRTLLLLLLILGSSVLHAQDDVSAAPAATTQSPAQALAKLRDQLDATKAALQDKTPSIALPDLRGQALAVQGQADQLVARLAPEIDSLQAQLTVLGPAPAKGAPAEAPAVSTQRRQLDKAKADLDAQSKQAMLLSQDAQQVAAQAARLRSDKFQAQLASRTASPFSTAFWSEPAHTLPDDLARLNRFDRSYDAAWHDAWQPAHRLRFLLCLGAALLLALAGRRWLEHLLIRAICRFVPDGHLRRSLLALGIALSMAFTLGMAAQLAYLSLNWSGTLDPDLADVAEALVRRVCVIAYVVGLGRAVLSAARPSWRLPALSDAAAQRLRPFPWLLGGSALLLSIIERINRAIGASLPATISTRAMIAVVIAGLIGAGMLRLGGARRALQASGAKPAQRPLWVGLLAAATVLGTVLALLAVAFGFIAFGFFLAAQMLWIGMVATTLYLLVHLTQDLFHVLLRPDGPSGKRLQSTFDLQPRLLEQAATVLSGVIRVLLFLLAIGAVLAGFGAQPQDLLARIGLLFDGLTLGQLTIKPGAVLNAVAVFVLGLFAVRVLKRWLGDQLLPKTAMEAGMQNSIITLLGYVGGVLVFALALAALNVSLQSIAWIASALSVGIGFGLQAIVQNFISGLILLAERPVKVGDWVSLDGNVEGDIRRINVRATEIQMWDRSTVIVPNSQLITQNVRNVTLANAPGRVLIKLPMPLDTNATRAREIILEAFHEHAAILAQPAPSALLESIDATTMSFSATGYVPSPRTVGSVRSEVLLSILERLRGEGLPLIRPQDMRVHTLPAPQASGEPARNELAATDPAAAKATALRPASGASPDARSHTSPS